jgi:hypothetical protein
MDDAETNQTQHTQPDLSTLAADVAHPFDQTNGIVEGLEGDANDPEQENRREGEDEGIVIGMPVGAPLGPQGGPFVGHLGSDDTNRPDRDADTDDPEGP